MQCDVKLRQKLSSLEPFSSNARLEMRPKFNTVSSQLDINCICVLNSSSLSLSWTNGPVVACFYYQHLYTRFQTSSCSSIEPKGSLSLLPIPWLHLSVPQLNLPCAKWIWSCVQSFYTVSSQSFFTWTFLVPARLEMRPKFNAVSSQPDLNWIYVPNFPHCPLVWTNGIHGSLFLLPTPVYALSNF